MLHPPGGVESGRDAEPNILGTHGTTLQVDATEQSAQAGTAGIGQGGQPLLYQVAVLVAQGDQVGDGAQGGQLQQRRISRGAEVVQQRGSKLVGNGGAAQLGEGVSIAGHPRVHDSDGVGGFRRRSMVVGDDDVGAGTSSMSHLDGVADAAVHGEDKGCALFDQPAYCLRGHAVAFGYRVGQVRDDLCAETVQGFG